LSGLTDLDPSFADGNVAFGVLLGALGAGTTVRACLPAPASERVAVDPPPDAPVDPFLALLLGTVVMHERLTSIVGPKAPVAPPAPAPAIAASPDRGWLR
jgi:hypothetical protein